MKSPPRPTMEAAEMLAIQALAFLAEDPKRLTRFLGMTGIEIEQIREAATDAGFLAGLLEHMLGDENLLIAFGEHTGIDPAEIVRAHRTLGNDKEDNLP
jgi:Protein of unknown function (DUF3572)